MNRKKNKHSFEAQQRAIGSKDLPFSSRSWSDQWLGWGALICSLLALCLDLSHFQRYNHGDSLMPSMSSLWHWEPFFWQQERYGMLVPWLAQPIKNPFWNLLFCQWVSIASALFLPWLLARRLWQQGPWPLLGLYTSCLLLGLTNHRFGFGSYSTSQFFTLPLVLAFLAYFILEGITSKSYAAQQPSATYDLNFLQQTMRFLEALLLLIIACWINISIPLMLGCLLIASTDFWVMLWQVLQLPRQSRSILGYFTKQAVFYEVIILLPTAFVGVFLLKRARYQEATYALSAVSTWLDGLIKGLNNLSLTMHEHQSIPYWGISNGLGFLAMVYLLLQYKKIPQYLQDPLKASVSLLGASILFGLFLSAQLWSQKMGYPDRYWYPAVFYLQVSTLGSLFLLGYYALSSIVRQKYFFQNRLISLFLEDKSIQAMVATFSLLIIIISSYGLPSVQVVKKDLHETMGSYTKDLIDSRCTHIMGSYWKVWPSMFHANWMLYEQGESRRIWAISNRSLPTLSIWGNIPLSQWRLAIINNDQEALYYSQIYHLPPFETLEKKATLEIKTFAKK